LLVDLQSQVVLQVKKVHAAMECFYLFLQSNIIFAGCSHCSTLSTNNFLKYLRWTLAPYMNYAMVFGLLTSFAESKKTKKQKAEA